MNIPSATSKRIFFRPIQKFMNDQGIQNVVKNILNFTIKTVILTK